MIRIRIFRSNVERRGLGRFHRGKIFAGFWGWLGLRLTGKDSTGRVNCTKRNFQQFLLLESLPTT